MTVTLETPTSPSGKVLSTLAAVRGLERDIDKYLFLRRLQRCVIKGGAPLTNCQVQA